MAQVFHTRRTLLFGEVRVRFYGPFRDAAEARQSLAIAGLIKWTQPMCAKPCAKLLDVAEGAIC